jgi:adenosylhomocysteine nucleosidase
VEQTVVVIAAHAFEARTFAGVGRAMTKEPWGSWMLYRGEMWDMPLAVVRCGPGKVAAAAAAQAAVQYLDPALLLSFGVAGCPDPTVELGTAIIARSVIDVALSQLLELPVQIPARFEATGELSDYLLAVPGAVGGVCLCWEGHVASRNEKPPILPDGCGPVVVDWESAAVAQVAEMWDVPWAVVKVVSDHGEEDRMKRLAVVAKRPLEWGAEVVRRACFAFLAEDLVGGQTVSTGGGDDSLRSADEDRSE